MDTNRFCRLLGIDHPIVLGPFGGLSSADLTAAVSDCGGLGSFGLYGFSPDQIATTVTRLRDATSRPFSVNLWLPMGDEVAPGEVDLTPVRAAVDPFFEEVGVPQPELPGRFLPDSDEQLDAALAGRPAALSFVYGVPPAWVIERARDQGTIVIGTATTVSEAIALEAGGADAIVASGSEAAGHRTSFLRPPEQSLVGTFALVPQVADAVKVPVIAAGGVADRRGVAAAFALGASGVQVGTAFLVTRESAASSSHRAAIRSTSAEESVLTRAMSGRLSRGAANRATEVIESTGAIVPFPAQNWLTGQFRAHAGSQNRGHLQSLWLGQGAPLATRDGAEAVFAELVAGIPPA